MDLYLPSYVEHPVWGANTTGTTSSVVHLPDGYYPSSVAGLTSAFYSRSVGPISVSDLWYQADVAHTDPINNSNITIQIVKRPLSGGLNIVVLQLDIPPVSFPPSSQSVLLEQSGLIDANFRYAARLVIPALGIDTPPDRFKVGCTFRGT